MFVDEGFGYLDEEALAQAICTLQRLAEGNRLVGIISHVESLKEKIEKQIVVIKEKAVEAEPLFRKCRRERSIANGKENCDEVSLVSIVVNLTLSLLKLAAGIAASSGAMISDAVHSASDVFSTFIVMIGVQISSKKSDADHQYGHERLECVASIVLAVVLCITGCGIGYRGLRTVLAGRYEELAIPGRLALLAAVLSIIVKEWMFWYTRAAAKKLIPAH